MAKFVGKELWIGTDGAIPGSNRPLRGLGFFLATFFFTWVSWVCVLQDVFRGVNISLRKGTFHLISMVD